MRREERGGDDGAGGAIPLIAGGLAVAAVAAAVVAVLLDHASTDLYLGATIAAAVGTALFIIHLIRSRADLSAWTAVAPLGVVLGLLGVAASGASCGVACIAVGAPIAGLALCPPNLNLRRLRRPALR